MPPQVVDAIPWRRLRSMDLVYCEREAATRDVAEARERESDQQRLDAEHTKKMADMGLSPSGQPLQGG